MKAYKRNALVDASSKVTRAVVNAVRDHLQQYHLIDKPLTLAYSGGMDSQVLLHALTVLRRSIFPQLRLQAIHINHGLQSAAEDWQAFCQQQCAAYEVAYQAITLQLAADVDSGNLEARARQARYRACFEAMHGDQLLTGHHQRDQAETLCLQLLRGTGVKGAAGMPAVLSKAGKQIHRPFLQLSHPLLVAYAKQQALTWIVDSSNQDTRFSRNFLRVEVLPVLRTRWQDLDARFAESAAHFGEADHLLETLASIDLQRLFQADQPSPTSEVVFSEDQTKQRSRVPVQGMEEDFPRSWQMPWLPIDALLALPPPRRVNVLRFWLRKLTDQVPGRQLLETLQQSVLCAPQDSQADLVWQGVRLRRYAGRVMLQQGAQATHASEASYDWSAGQAFSGSPWLYPIEAARRQCLLPYAVSGLTLRFRQGGETIQLQGAAHHTTLKKLFHQLQIPPWLRSQIPLVYARDRLVAILLPKQTLFAELNRNTSVY